MKTSAPVASVEASNPFAALVGTRQGGTGPPPAPDPPTLLTAFAGGAGLLAAFVLSEALAPPLALRER
ncbi:MAG: hypothetical protein GIX03_03930 [Candidatus Eremiobacteraeota bacterium]|nr:hypothetical protein [Candidatus Eremiobacteraeota bacterium]MBC5802156.1 hypothetical protein [Candidatus Eremiobacteraeota bacterium]MBC5821792.1 hypothetical protein [Candidatus Eremiobacteraeota bacterium]